MYIAMRSLYSDCMTTTTTSDTLALEQQLWSQIQVQERYAGEQAAKRLGKWLKANGEAVYGTKASPFPKPLPWGRVTQKGNKLYLHVFDTKAGTLTLPGLKTRVKSARTLADLVRRGDRA